MFPSLSSASTASPPIAPTRGRWFQFTLPDGWRVIDEGQFAVVLGAPDHSALTLMVGNCGLPNGYNPLQYAYERITELRPQDLWLGPPRVGRAVAGFPTAWEADCTYVADRAPWRGVATVHVRPGYDAVDMVLTFAAAREAQWPGYAPWLPQVAAQFTTLDGSAFGAGAGQNLHDCAGLGQAWPDCLDASGDLQGMPAAGRADAAAWQDDGMGDILTGKSWFGNPSGHPSERLSNPAAVYWAHRDGRVISSDDPAFDPRTPADPDWQRMSRQGA